MSVNQIPVKSMGIKDALYQHRNREIQIQTSSLHWTLNHSAFLGYGMSKESPNKPESTSPCNPKSPSGFGVVFGFVLFSSQCAETCYPFQLLCESSSFCKCILEVTASIQESWSFFLAHFPHSVNSFWVVQHNRCCVLSGTAACMGLEKS